MSDLSKYCVPIGERGAGSSKRRFPHFIVYRAVMAVGVGILYNSGDFPILHFGN